MNLSWRVGRLRSVLVLLNYTWLPVAALGVWVLARIWLPPYLPKAPAETAWILAGGALFLYGVSLVLIEAVRTRLAGGFSPQWPRAVHLFPFGAAFPYPLAGVGAGRALISTGLGPALLGLFGLGYWTLADQLAGNLSRDVVATLHALALAHLANALLNLLPGVPLAGGWVVVALLHAAHMPAVHAVRLMSRAGLLLAGGLLLLGGAEVMREDWLPALVLLTVAWTVREGVGIVEEQIQTGGLLDHVAARTVMQAPRAVVHPEDSLAQVFRRQPQYGPVEVLPVEEANGRFAGLLPLALRDQLLQGTWPQTAVRTVMRPADQLTTVGPETPLPAVMTLLGHTPPPLPSVGADAAPLGYVPVVAKDHLQGLIGWDDVAAYDELATAAGVQEAAALDVAAHPRRSRRAWLGELALYAAGIWLLATLSPRMGSLGTTPTPTPTPQPHPVVARYPAVDGLIAVDKAQTTIQVDLAGIPDHWTLRLDGHVLSDTVESPGPAVNTTRLTVAVSGLVLGQHIVQVQADETGTDWAFQVLQSDATHQFFPQTGYFVSDAFLTFWQTQGGLDRFGHPLGDPVVESSPAGTHISQYFERARLEQQGTGPVQIAALGLLIHPLDPAVRPQPEAQYFPATGHNLSGTFLEYWQSHGGLASFGSPISEEMEEVLEGTAYRVQYFERARFEWHPQAAGTPWEVTLGALGREVLAQAR